jgi:hypothetical protein
VLISLTLIIHSVSHQDARESIPFNKALMKPNPDFVDERKPQEKPKNLARRAFELRTLNKLNK